MKTENRNIGWDYSGNVGSPKETSLKRLVGLRADNNAWTDILKRFVRVYTETCKDHGEDLALADFYSGIAALGVNKADFSEVSRQLLDKGLIRPSVIGAMTTLAKQGARNIIVTKNLAEEGRALADEVNRRAGLEVISGVVGATGRYDTNGNLTGVEEIIGDYEGMLPGINIQRILKRDAVKRAIGNSPLAGYVTDTGDADIRETANTALIIRSSVPYDQLDEYFQISADKATGNYQAKAFADGKWDAILNDGDNLERDLVRMLGKETS